MREYQSTETGGSGDPGSSSLRSGLPLSEQAYRIIRDGILRGAIAAGDRLKIEVLQRVHRISSSPLREALNRLVAENLVIADERRGFRAAPVTADDLADLTAIRVVVEPGALTASLGKGDDEWEARIVAAFHRLDRIERRIATGEATRDDAWMTRHKDFHIALISGCGSQRLIATCAKLFDQSERYRRLSASLRRIPRDTATEHQEIMEAALRRDQSSALLLRKHIERTAEHVLAALGRSQA